MEWLEQQDEESVNVALGKNPLSLLMSFEENDDAIGMPKIASIEPDGAASDGSPTMEDNVMTRNAMMTPTYAAPKEPSVIDDEQLKPPVLSGASTIVPA
eukprot:5953232-Prymnesium_polylepis.1